MRLAITLLLLFSITGSALSEKINVDSLEVLLSSHNDEDTARVNLLNKIALGYAGIDSAKSARYADMSIELSDKLDYKKGKAGGYFAKGRNIAIRRSHPLSSLYYTLAVDIASRAGILDDACEYRQHLGASYFLDNKIDLAIECHEKNSEICSATGNQILLARSLGSLGMLSRIKGDMFKALEYYYRSLEITTALGDDYVSAATINNIGTVYHSLGNYEKALEHFFQSMKLKEKVGDRKGLINSYLNVGKMYSSLGDNEKSLTYLNKALEIATEFDDHRSLGQCYECFGSVYETVDKAKALEYYHKALAAAREVSFNQTIVTGLVNLGGIYSQLKQYSLAQQYYSEALEKSIQGKRAPYTADIFVKMGLLSYKMKQYSKAIDYSTRGIEIGNQLNLTATKRDGYHNLYLINNARGDHKEAFNNLSLYRQYNDSLNTDKNIKKLAEQEFLYRLDTEKQARIIKMKAEEEVAATRQKTNDILKVSFAIGIGVVTFLIVIIFILYRQKRKKNRLLAIQKAEIEQKHIQLNKLIDGKDKFFSILAHDLKGSFNSILGISDLLSQNIDNYTKEEVEEMAEGIYQSSENTYKLLENLLTLSKANVGIIEYNPSRFVLCDIIRENKSDWEKIASSKQIEVKCSSEGDCNLLADKNMINIVLRNLIINAIKYTNDGGTVEVSVNRKEEGVEITVTDNGIGMSKQTISNLFGMGRTTSSPGTKNETGTGLGLLICKEFVGKHHGKISVESEIGLGSRFTVLLPTG